MSENDDFKDLIARVRAGDQDAAAELVLRFEAQVRGAVKTQLHDHRLRRSFDSVDICQSVLGGFFVRAAMGQFKLEKADDLKKLLATMARNKLATKARQPQVRRRDYRSLEADSAANDPLLAPDSSPSRIVAGKDLLQAVRERLTAEERLLAEQRAAGLGWAEIAATTSANPEALRKKLARALGRVIKELGLEEAVSS